MAQGAPMDDAAAIQAVIDHMASAWNRGDAASWTEPFSPDATFVTVFGQEFENRDVNRNKHEKILAGVFQGSCIVTEIRRLRLVRPDVAVVALDVRLHVPDGQEERLRRTRLLHVMEKHEGHWRIVASQNTDLAKEH